MHKIKKMARHLRKMADNMDRIEEKNQVLAKRANLREKDKQRRIDKAATWEKRIDALAMSRNEFCALVPIDPGFLSRILNQDSPPSDGTITKVEKELKKAERK